jgi:protein-disulfide isomerase
MKRNLTVSLCLLLLAGVAAAEVNGSVLKPPAGASVAIVVFEDLECPSCALAAPQLEEAAKYYKVPLIIHDFPLPQHPWAMDAAVMARYIEDARGRAVSDAFRDYIYQNQNYVTKDNLRQYAEKFAGSQSPKLDLPFMLDPKGEIKAKIQADKDLGAKIGLEETPTVIIVSTKGWKAVKPITDLYITIQQMQKEAGPPPAAAKAPAKSAAKGATKKKS